MNTQIINVINELCKRFGIVIDWASQNVMPKLQEVIVRYTRYRIAASATVSGICFVLIIACIFISVKVIKDCFKCRKEKKNTFLWDHFSYDGSLGLTGIGWGVVGITGFVFLVALVMGIAYLGDLFKWIYIPEMQFVETIYRMVGGQV